MHRFYFPQNISGSTAVLSDPELTHQIRKVLRLTSGDSFVLFNEQSECVVTISDIEGNKITGIVKERYKCSRDMNTKVTVFQGLLKKDKFEWVLQKLTEVGVSKIIPMETEFCVVKEVSKNKGSRYNKIIQEAVEQCGGCKIPKLLPTHSFSEAINSIPKNTQAYICYEKEDSLAFTKELLEHNHSEIYIFIGPEGGFSQNEINDAQKRGIQIVHLGKRILRSETASIIAASLAVNLSN